MPNGGPAGAGYVVVARRAPARLGSARRRNKQRCRVHGGSERSASRGRRGRDGGSRADGLAGGLRPPLWGIARAERAPDRAQGGGRSTEGAVSGEGHLRSNSQGAERSCRRAREGRRQSLEGAERRSAAIGHPPSRAVRARREAGHEGAAGKRSSSAERTLSCSRTTPAHRPARTARHRPSRFNRAKRGLGLPSVEVPGQGALHDGWPMRPMRGRATTLRHTIWVPRMPTAVSLLCRSCHGRAET